MQLITWKFNQVDANSPAFAQSYMDMFLLSALSRYWWLHHNIRRTLTAEATMLQQLTSLRRAICFATTEVFHGCSGGLSIKNI